MKKNLIILCFHGVTKKLKKKNLENFSGKHIYYKDFKNQILKLKKNKFNFIAYEQVVNNIKNKIAFPKNTACLTFDDGFMNNFQIAAPILKKNKIPAIFFLCPKNIENQEMFWVDKIEDCINRTKKRNIAIYLKRKNLFSLKSQNEKIKCINTIKNYCKNINVLKKNLIINEVIKISGILPSMKSSPNYKIATWPIIKKTIKNKLFSLGGHSLEHDIYTNLSKSEVRKNIKKTIEIIKKKTNYKIKHFSYPEGQKMHFNKYIISELKKNNIISCPTAIYGKNNHKDHLFNLKRIMIGFNNIKLPN
jgi:peptidoglycan/xylan/chitin deacetylase (PgdA/CDA1 family)